MTVKFYKYYFGRRWCSHSSWIMWRMCFHILPWIFAEEKKIRSDLVDGFETKICLHMSVIVNFASFSMGANIYLPNKAHFRMIVIRAPSHTHICIESQHILCTVSCVFLLLLLLLFSREKWKGKAQRKKVQNCKFVRHLLVTFKLAENIHVPGYMRFVCKHFRQIRRMHGYILYVHKLKNESFFCSLLDTKEIKLIYNSVITRNEIHK